MKGKRHKRNIVLFLVEGKADRNALQIAISELYDRIDENIEVFFPTIREDSEEVGGDITSKIGSHPRNIEEKIYKLFLQDFFDEEKILPKDISEIIQIIDMDGVYVPDDAVREVTDSEFGNRVYYGNNEIICPNRARILKRNECKRENLDYLSSLSVIKVKQKRVPYSAYYFSSNLDHFIHHDANLEYRLKSSLADTYARNYLGNIEGFVRDISEDPGAVKGMSYDESWSYIKQGTNSLCRYTNINVLFESLRSDGQLL